MPTTPSTAELRQLVKDVPFWWHSIDVGGGVVTPGKKPAAQLAKELANYQLPDLHGKTVLDIGAWDGYFSFQAERLGAQRVVALDHFVWSLDFSATSDEAQAAARQASKLPGKRGFDLAHRLLHSRVESVVADFMETDLAALGQFDVVFFLGVLYHMRHPLLSLERLAQLTRGYAIIETEAVYFGPLEKQAWCEFFDKDQLGHDPTNWWAPNLKAVVDMCHAAGFRQVDVLVGPDPKFHFKGWLKRLECLVTGKPPVYRYRLVARAHK